ncbi:MAG: hypothetical protein IJK18_08210 [Clostridia bacterium]|nr:hypothetical protein [Clostridia bacterium]
MKRIDYKELAKRLAIRGIRGYKQRFIQEEDLLSGEDKRRVLEEIDKIIEQIKEDKFYKRKAEYLQQKIDSICSLEDCNEEFEL